ncbi:alpha/beta hydrolase-fold protein [Priestia flexa]|uniref:alpha/beta hydrolase-fold protein n=1 Tax=Priestia flexa TaxID=86664 RepID=UPI00077C1444|nr:alpha/beta hydrolase-fold protein [Priestia flexa]MED4588180.1 alpha/beta hydrolase-fold protein [Priestia flexa]
MSDHSIVEISNFKSIHLQNERNWYVYLPPSYKQAQNTTYPVLYMHDGQNIFHPAFNRQLWNVHHVVNRLVEQGKMQEIIIVGIENMKEERANEYSVQVPPALACIQPKGEYQVENERIVSIAKDGTIIPKSVGKTVVQFQSEGIVSSKEIEIVDYLSDRVPVSIQVNSKDALLDALRIYADLPLKKVDSHHFYNRFILPIDTGLGFRLYLDDGKGEVDDYGAPIHHCIMITHPLHKKFTVKRWL